MEIIGIVINGLGEAFGFVPVFINAVLDTVSNLFISGTGESTTGTIVLGCLITVVGVALTINLFKLPFRLLRLKRRA